MDQLAKSFAKLLTGHNSSDSRLCKYCAPMFKPDNFQHIQRKSPVQGSYWGDHPQATYLLPEKHIRSTASQCILCKWIGARVRQLQEKFGWTFEFPLSVQVELRPADGSGDVRFLTLGLQYISRRNKRDSHRATFEVLTPDKDPASTWILARPVNPEVASQTAFEKAKTWIAECLSNHEECSTVQNQWMPTRVLDVQDVEQIRLYVTKGQIYPYVALSYCWGDIPNMISTTDSLQSRFRGSHLSKFPQTLQDAIIVTRRLGYRYLWIDSLCILQDDKNDKIQEIAQMRYIFRNAILTIIAASASDSHAGFLQKREMQQNDDLVLPYPCPDGTSGNMYLQECFTEDQKFQYDPALDPISKRAWTLEERLLSPRRLIYTKTHLRFLSEKNEYSDGGNPKDRTHQGHIYSGPPKSYRTDRLPTALSSLSSSTSVPSSYPSDDAWVAWHSILTDYNMRSLTEPSDKLRAISGIAELYAAQVNDTYLAGLWRAHLIPDLLWQRSVKSVRDKTKELSPRPLTYRAPSWSWAAVDGPILNRQVAQNDKVIDRFSVISCTTEPKSSKHPMSAVANGKLVVSGRIKKMGWNLDIGTLHELHAMRKSRFMVPSVGTAHADARETVGDVVWCLEVISRHGTRKGPQEGLILVPVRDGEGEEEHRENCWRRVGYFCTSDLDADLFVEEMVWEVIVL